MLQSDNPTENSNFPQNNVNVIYQAPRTKFKHNFITIKRSDLKYKRPANPYITYQKEQFKTFQQQFPMLNSRGKHNFLMLIYRSKLTDC